MLSFCVLVRHLGNPPSIEFNPPEISAKVGSEAVIQFSVQPADLNIDEPPLLKKIFSESTSSLMDPEFNIELQERRIIFPEVTCSDAGVYELSCNEDCSATFQLKVLSKYYNK